MPPKPTCPLDRVILQIRDYELVGDHQIRALRSCPVCQRSEADLQKIGDLYPGGSFRESWEKLRGRVNRI